MSKTNIARKRADKRELVKTLSTTIPRHETETTIRHFLASLDCPRSLTVWLLLSNGEHDQLSLLEFQATNYNDMISCRDSLAATSLLSKSNFLNISGCTKQRAYEKFQKFEDRCGWTNRHLFEKIQLADPISFRILFRSRSIIAQILGRFCPEEFVDSCSWGPGATTTMKSSDASATNKFHVERGITPSAYAFIEPWFEKVYPSWGKHIRENGGFMVTPGNKIVTVPKNSRIDRVIAIEPGLNLWFQKGIGTIIRKRLRRFGLNLNTQENNQLLAKRSSLDGSLVTVDFSSASDSISIESVRHLLPDRWFSVLSAFRSDVGFFEGDNRVLWKKFSSMGNGYTFELESLLFYAVALATAQELKVSNADIVVFGDDVILPTQLFQHFERVVDILGFQINTSKTCLEGYYRESCGSFYYNGIDIKPIYLKGVLTNVESLYKLANNIRRLSHRYNCHYGCDLRLKYCWTRLYFLCPESLRFQISEGFGDIGFIDNLDIAVPSIKRASRGFEGFFASCLCYRPVTREHHGTGLLLDQLKNGSIDKARHNDVPSKSQVIKGISSLLIPKWYNLGGWI